jgi:hypothetical protein
MPQHCCAAERLLHQPHPSLLCWCVVVQVPDAEAARFIACCVGDPQQRYTASQLLEDPFLQVRRMAGVTYVVACDTCIQHSASAATSALVLVQSRCEANCASITLVAAAAAAAVIGRCVAFGQEQ